MACRPTPREQAERDLQTINKEHTAERLLERGKAFAAIGDHTRAEEYIAAAIDRGADRRDAMPLLLDVCVRSGRYRSAIQHGENHLRLHPHDARTRLVVATLYTALDEPKHARAELEKVVEQKPNEAEAHYLLAVVARDSEHDVVEADRHFREYLRIEPNGAHAEEAKASLLKRMP
jgi:tetratricopeptide (TPR) repeat protein